jgi:3-oxoadipate enol-lactonase
MPFAKLKTARIHYNLTAASDLPVLVFSNSLGTDFSMWDAQFEALSRTFRILRYDTRGHGQSSSTSGAYTIEQLGKDLIGLLDALKLPRVHFCGLSIGGLTGMWLGIHAPDRCRKIVLCNTALKIGTTEGWNARIETVTRDGIQSIAPQALERWFTASFRTRFPQVVRGAEEMLVSTSKQGYVGCCAAIRDADFSAESSTNFISSISVPTLVVAGTHDPVATVADAHAIVQNIPGAKYAEMDAAHLSNIEDAAAFSMELERFLTAE